MKGLCNAARGITDHCLCRPDDIIGGVCCASPPCNGLWEWTGLAGIALTASAAILAFIYMWATLFRNAQMNAYVKQELYELLVSAVMVVLIYAAVGAVGDLTLGYFLPVDMYPSGTVASTTIYEASGMYFERLDRDMSGWLQMNYFINVYVDQVASVTPYARPLGVGLVASPMAGLASPLKQLLYNMSVALSVAFIINFAQLAVYVFSLAAFLNYYLPVGIFLRCFTPTRRLGGTIIGVAVAFIFIYPVITTLTYAMFYNPESGPLVTFNEMFSHYMNDVFGRDDPDNPVVSLYDNNLSETGTGLIDMMTGAFGAIGRMLSNIVGGFFLMLLLLPMATISMAFAIGFIMPTINIMIFTQAAKGLSKSFGEEVDISSLTRMI
jgi:hypothetical protein